MPTIIDGKDLLDRFKELCSKSTRIDIAVAWAGPSEALDAIVNRAKSSSAKVRMIVGINGRGTHPDALQLLLQHTDLRVIWNKTGGLFHPKFYRFGLRANPQYLVGSANLTAGGFLRNDEFMALVDDDDGAGAAWFQALWDSLDGLDHRNRVNDYISSWKPPTVRPRLPPGVTNTIRSPHVLLVPNMSWSDYVEALTRCDEHWATKTEDWEEPFSVFGDRMSWLQTIEEGHGLSQLPSWVNLDKEQSNVMMPRRSSDVGLWGLLGSMKSAAHACSEFNKNSARREQIRKLIAPALLAQSTDDFILEAAASIRGISKIYRFKTGVATRLLTLARPDRAVSINKGSVKNLRKILPWLHKTPGTVASPDNYPQLLAWVYDQPWYKSDRPTDAFQRRLWDARAALIDAFVYVHPTPQ